MEQQSEPITWAHPATDERAVPSWASGVVIMVVFALLTGFGGWSISDSAGAVDQAGVANVLTRTTFATTDVSVAGTVVDTPQPVVITFGSGREEVGRAALAQITYGWEAELDGWTLHFGDARGSLLGGTYPYEKRIEVYVAPTDSPTEVGFTLAHEIAHAIDVTHFGPEERDAWAEARSIPDDVGWWVLEGADFGSGSGDFAESFAVWQTGGASHSDIGGDPTDEQLDVLIDLLP